MKLWSWFSFRQLLTHRFRVLLVLLGIALGTAVFTSVRLAINASLDSFTQSMDTIAGKADWTVIRPGGRVPDRLVRDLLSNPTITAASPLLTAYLKPAQKGAIPFLLIGLDPILDRHFRSWESSKKTPESGRLWLDLIAEPNTLVISRSLLQRLGAEVGATIGVEYFDRLANFRILAELDSQGLALADAGYVAIADMATMQEFLSLHGQVDRIDIMLKPTATSEEIAKIRAELPPGVVLAKPNETKESGALMIRAYQLNLSVLSFVSLFVGMFLVYSLISLNATSRRHELAVLRSIGASTQMIFLLFIAEGAFFGIVGWLIAMPIGSIMVRKLLDTVSSTISHLFVRVTADQLNLDPLELVLSFLVTLFVSVLAAYQPAREATSVPPQEAFLMHEKSLRPEKSTKKLAIMGFLLVCMVWPLSRLPATFGIPLCGYIATFCLFTGFSLLSPGCLLTMGAYLPPILKKFAGQPAYLGSRYLRDAGPRVAISVGALITAMALFFALVIMVHSFRNTVETWVNQSIRGDLFLQMQMANTNDYRDPLPDRLVAELQAKQGQVELLPYRRIFLQRNATRYVFEAIDFSTFSRHGELLFLQGDSQTIMPRLIAGDGVVVSEVLANQMNLHAGDFFRENIGGVAWNLPVLGVYRDYRTQGGVVHYSLQHFQQLTGNNTWSGVRVFFNGSREAGGSRASSGNDRLAADIYQLAAQSPGVVVTRGGDLRSEILRIFDETFAVTSVLLLIALFVAALGITTTLTILVLERTRQLNTLLAIGASLAQIRAMIFWEAVLMVVAGEVLGAGCGFILSNLLIFVINKQSFGWTFLYSVDWQSLLLSLPLIMATALLAALPATQMAFRQSPATLLRAR